MSDCVFCRRDSMQIIGENDLALAFYDMHPVSRGHVLVIPKRHVDNFFEASAEEHQAMAMLITDVRYLLQKKYDPDGYNIGANCGRAAGQTVFHYHLHIIPRYDGDVKDPRGGVRKVIPNRNCHPESSRASLH